MEDRKTAGQEGDIDECKSGGCAMATAALKGLSHPIRGRQRADGLKNEYISINKCDLLCDEVSGTPCFVLQYFSKMRGIDTSSHKLLMPCVCAGSTPNSFLGRGAGPNSRSL